MVGGYDDGYRSCPCFWGRDPGSLVLKLSEIVSSFQGLRVFDAGCGEGKNSIFFARRGALVTAIDVSAVALANARTAWGDNSDCNWVLGDIQRFNCEVLFYDVVLAYGLLHCLPDADAIERTVAMIHQATKSGGYNLIVAFNDRSQDLSAHPGFAPCLLHHSEYERMYSHWDLIHFSDSNLEEVHPNNNIRHVHSLTRILARKK